MWRELGLEVRDMSEPTEATVAGVVTLSMIIRAMSESCSVERPTIETLAVASQPLQLSVLMKETS